MTALPHELLFAFEIRLGHRARDRPRKRYKRLRRRRPVDETVSHARMPAQSDGEVDGGELQHVGGAGAPDASRE